MNTETPASHTTVLVAPKGKNKLHCDRQSFLCRDKKRVGNKSFYEATYQWLT